MKKPDLIALLERYNPYDENEKKYKMQMLDFLNNADDFLGKKNQEGHITASALVVNYDKSKVLLNHHLKLDKWIQFGGHTEEDDQSVLTAAMRETEEESGLKNLKYISQEIFDIDIHSIPAKPNVPKHFHYDIRFLFEADENEEIVVSNESKDVKWVRIDEVAEYSQEPAILRMVEKTVKINSFR